MSGDPHHKHVVLRCEAGVEPLRDAPGQWLVTFSGLGGDFAGSFGRLETLVDGLARDVQPSPDFSVVAEAEFVKDTLAFSDDLLGGDETRLCHQASVRSITPTVPAVSRAEAGC